MVIVVAVFLVGAGLWWLSDARMKRDVVLLYRRFDGLGVYRYRYAGSDQRYVGVIAQEVQTLLPSAVMCDAEGHLRVDYSQIGIEPETWEEWAAA